MKSLNVNGVNSPVVPITNEPLLWLIREQLNLKGTKYGCGVGACGACTVLIDNQATRSCQVSANDIAGEILTIEGIKNTTIGKIIINQWNEHDVAQCGYCQAGQIVSAYSLLIKNSSPSTDQIIEAMAGNICRCGTYPRIVKAIQSSAEILTQSLTS